MSSSTFRNVIQARAGGAVERCHVVHSLGSYSNAAHQWGVAMLLLQLFPLEVACHPVLLKVALCHDIGEFIWGDVPAPALRFIPGLSDLYKKYEGETIREMGLPTETSLTPGLYNLFKACDRLELYLWCREQRALGSRFADEVLRELESYFEVEPPPGPASEFLQWLRTPEPDGTDRVVPRQASVARETVEKLK